MAQSAPLAFRLGRWACQDRLTVDAKAGLGVAPDENLLGEPVAVYRF